MILKSRLGVPVLICVYILQCRSGSILPSGMVVYFVNDRSAYFPDPPYRAFLKDVLGEAASSWSWREHSSADFFAKELAFAPAGSIVLLQTFHFEERESFPVVPRDAKRPLLSWPRQWKLMNHSRPLIVIVYDAGGCYLEWPTPTHHLLYLSSWCAEYHKQWSASKRLEPPAPKRWPWMRDAPFGSAFDGGRLAEISSERREAKQRRILFSFRGSSNSNKPSRVELEAEWRENSNRLGALAERLLRGAPRHPSGVGRAVVDIRGPGRRYSENVTYLELLRDSVFTLSPPGDVWEGYRTWEAMEAGSIPVVVRTADDEVYGGCRNPSAHLLETAPVLSVGSWKELEHFMEHEASNMSAVKLRQQSMLEWLSDRKRTLRSEIVDAARMMHLGGWRPRTHCSITPLGPSEQAKQASHVARYLQRPLLPSSVGFGTYRCATPDCKVPPLVHDFWCK